jgi:hypothetical protein
LVQDPLAMRILDGSVLPGDLVRVAAEPESDFLRFERVEEKAAPAPEPQAEAAGSGASATKSSRRAR